MCVEPDSDTNQRRKPQGIIVVARGSGEDPKRNMRGPRDRSGRQLDPAADVANIAASSATRASITTAR